MRATVRGTSPFLPLPASVLFPLLSSHLGQPPIYLRRVFGKCRCEEARPCSFLCQSLTTSSTLPVAASSPTTGRTYIVPRTSAAATRCFPGLTQRFMSQRCQSSSSCCFAAPRWQACASRIASRLMFEDILIVSLPPNKGCSEPPVRLG